MANHIAWTFRTARFCVSLEINEDVQQVYDGDDENGETQAALDTGKLVMFDSRVCVYLDGRLIGYECLGASCYFADDVASFWTAHRDSDPMNRNCSIMRAKRGNCAICHYFPDMVRIAINEARKALSDVPRMRKIV